MHLRALLPALALALPLLATPQQTQRNFADLQVEIGEASSFEISLGDNEELPPPAAVKQNPRGEAAQ